MSSAEWQRDGMLCGSVASNSRKSPGCIGIATARVGKQKKATGSSVGEVEKHCGRYAHGKEELKNRYTTLCLMEKAGRIVNANTYLARPCMTWVMTGAW